MSTEQFDQPAYYLEHFKRTNDDDDWFFAVFKDPSEGDTGGLTVIVSGDALSSLLRQGKDRALSGAAVMDLDGK